jgi:hypothetical protein
MRRPADTGHCIALDMYAHGVAVAGPVGGQTRTRRPDAQAERSPTGAAATLPAVRRQVVTGVLVFAVAATGIGLLRSGSELHPPFPKQDAPRAALRDPRVRAVVVGSGWTDARVIALDRRHWRVTFFDGPRYVLDAAVDRGGHVDAIEQHTGGVHPAGADVLWNPAVLVGFAALFVLAVAVRPFRARRNLDAAVIVSAFTLSMLLLDDRLVAAHVYVGAAALIYVAARCLRVALDSGPAPVPRPVDVGRLLPAITVATLLAAILIVLTSSGISDVALAGLAGGTLLNHGISPYGHITADVVHGDTYPLLTYVLYMPFAALGPVHDSFDSLDGALWLNAIALVAAAAVFSRWDTRTSLAWMAFPPVLLAASGGGNDVPAAFFVAAALAAFAATQLSVGLLTLAGWVKIAPAVALVAFLARLRGAALPRAIAVVLGLLAAGVVAMLVVGGGHAIDRSLTALQFQFERGSWFSLWRQLGVPGLQVAFQALTLTFLFMSALALRRHPELSFRRVAALAGTAVALVQLSANYWAYWYLPWLLPFVLVALFPPALPRSPRLARRAP